MNEKDFRIIPDVFFVNEEEIKLLAAATGISEEFIRKMREDSFFIGNAISSQIGAARREGGSEEDINGRINFFLDRLIYSIDKVLELCKVVQDKKTACSDFLYASTEKIEKKIARLRLADSLFGKISGRFGQKELELEAELEQKKDEFYLVNKEKETAKAEYAQVLWLKQSLLPTKEDFMFKRSNLFPLAKQDEMHNQFINFAGALNIYDYVQVLNAKMSAYAKIMGEHFEPEPFPWLNRKKIETQNTYKLPLNDNEGFYR